MSSDNDTKIESFADLYAWQEGHKLVLETYKITRSFPNEELFGLANQLRRAVVSITSNLAEGFSRNSFKDKLQFWVVSLGLLTEVQSQLLIARDVGYIESNGYEKLLNQSIVTSKLINGLILKN